MPDHNYFANLIWQIADLLRGPYRPPQYERVMLPMTVLRRFDCVLAPTKAKVLAEHERRKGGRLNDEALDRILNNAAGQRFHNHSPLDFVKLKGGGAGGKDKSLTGWNTSHVTRWIDGLNRVFSPQANIGFKQNAVKEPPVDRYSGATAQYKTGEEWNTEVGHVRDGTADANVFLVGSWKGISEDRFQDVYGSYIHGVHDIVCDDPIDHRPRSMNTFVDSWGNCDWLELERDCSDLAQRQWFAAQFHRRTLVRTGGN